MVMDAKFSPRWERLHSVVETDDGFVEDTENITIALGCEGEGDDFSFDGEIRIESENAEHIANLCLAAPTMAEALERCAAPLTFKTDDLIGVAAEVALEVRRRQDIARAALRAARGEQGEG